MYLLNRFASALIPNLSGTVDLVKVVISNCDSFMWLGKYEVVL